MEIPLITPSSFLPSFAVLQSLELRNGAQLCPHTQRNQPFCLSPFTGHFFSLIFVKEELNVEQSQCQFQHCCREGLPPQPGRDESRAFSESELLHLMKFGTFLGSSSDILSFVMISRRSQQLFEWVSSPQAGWPRPSVSQQLGSQLRKQLTAIEGFGQELGRSRAQDTAVQPWGFRAPLMWGRRSAHTMAAPIPAAAAVQRR